MQRNNGEIYRTSDLGIEHTGIPFGNFTSGNVGSYAWDRNDPFRMIGTVRGGNQLISLDVRNPSATTTLYTAGSEVTIGGRQGQPNEDDQSKVILQTSSQLILFDLTSNSVIRTLNRSGIDWAGFSKTGDYYIIASSANGLQIYRTSDDAFTGGRSSPRHGDFTRANGVEYFATTGSPPTWIRLSNGATTSPGSDAIWGHYSGLGHDDTVVFSADLAGNVGGVGEIDVLDPPENIRRIGTQPTHISGGFSDTQHRITRSWSGEYMLVTIANPTNVANDYLVTKVCP